MKKLLTVVFTMLLVGGLAFAQATGDSTSNGASDTGKKAAKAHKGGKKGHKGGKKGKKGSGDASGSTTPK